MINRLRETRADDEYVAAHQQRRRRLTRWTFEHSDDRRSRPRDLSQPLSLIAGVERASPGIPPATACRPESGPSNRLVRIRNLVEAAGVEPAAPRVRVVSYFPLSTRSIAAAVSLCTDGSTCE